MKLSSLPYILRKLVLDHMSINQIFFLSLCSKNTKNLIILTQKNQLKKVEQVNYWIDGKKNTIIDMKMVTSADPHAFMFFFKTPAGFSKKVIGGKDRGTVEEVRLNELGTSIIFFRFPSLTDLHAKYSSDNLESIIERIHDQLYDLLGHHTKFWSGWIPGGKTPFLPMLRNIRGLEVSGTAFATTTIDEYLSRATCLEYFFYNVPLRQTIEFEKCSRIYELDTVEVWAARQLPRDVMKYFNGRHAFLDCFSVSTSDIIQFLNSWESGEKFRNLEVISIINKFRVPDIRRSVEFKKLNKKIKYSYVRKFKRGVPITHHEFKTRSYLVRESDGHVASVLLSSEMVKMGVWNMTEEEFLKKFQ